jgi:hypothetical protein
MVGDVLGNGDEFSEGTLASEFVAGDPQNLAVLAQIDRAFFAVMAFTARDRGIESHTVSYLKALDLLADVLDNPGGFVAHDQRGYATTGAAVKAVDIAPADSARFDFHQ